jgi:hypothetical protein
METRHGVSTKATNGTKLTTVLVFLVSSSVGFVVGPWPVTAP